MTKLLVHISASINSCFTEPFLSLRARPNILTHEVLTLSTGPQSLFHTRSEHAIHERVIPMVLIFKAGVEP